MCLPSAAVERNKLLVARARQGKTTLMLHLARAAFQDRRRAVVFIDPHGDAVKSLVRMVPPGRVDDVVYLDFGGEARVPGWNLLDTGIRFSPELLLCE